MTTETETLPLIRTKLQRPRLPGDLVRRPRLTERMQRAHHHKLTLISAMAGTGKTTQLARWLEECPQPSAWLSLDEGDNDRIVFLTYLCGAIRTVYPIACDKALSFLHAPQTPTARAITTLIVNELDGLFADPLRPDLDAKGARSAVSSQGGGPFPNGLILALDDYHHITDPAIHEILSGLIEHLPQGVHLALATRTDPPLPLAGWRARGEMTEIRADDLRFTSEEAQVFLQVATGRELDPETLRLLEDKTEGWVVGLRLAALSMRTRSDARAFVQAFKGAGSDLIVEYLLSEVLARQSAEIQDFVLHTSVLDRFCAPLCEEVCWGVAPAAPATEVSAVRSQEIIEWLARANLFLIPLDQEGTWYRYHHLFRDLLGQQLRQRTSPADISGLHARAGAWFARNGWMDEALHHLLAADDKPAAVALVARHRYDLMNRVQWPRLNRYLQQFSPDGLDLYPDLLMLKTWLLYHRGRWLELPAALQRLETALPLASLPPETVRHLLGEISALRSLLHYYALDQEHALASAQEALARTPGEVWIVRILARLFLAGVLQMRGDSNRAHAAIYRGFEEEETQSNAFKATLVMTDCWVYWVDADLQGMAQAASQCIALSQQSSIPQILNYGHYHLGQVRYQQNDLAAAEEHFTAIVQQPYLNYGNCFAYSACGLALVHQVLGRPHQARTVIEAALAFMLQTGNTTLMPVIQAFQAELALLQRRIPVAGQWAAHLDPVPPFTPMVELFSPHLTLVKVWLAQDTPASRKEAAELVGRIRAFCESTHNTRFLIDALALQALLHRKEGDESASLAALEQAITLAEPGGFIRIFVDLGPGLVPLLGQLRQRGVATDYITRILIAFEAEDSSLPSSVFRPPVPTRVSSVLVEPLTPREHQVLALLARHLTNKEIAEELVVSPSTVKTHTLNIYRKLDVRGRKQAVARAREMGVLS